MIRDEPVVYVVICGSPVADGALSFVQNLKLTGWHPCVITTPMGARFVESSPLADLTGYPVRTDYKNPDDPDMLPPPDALVVAPATFNTVNKLAAGISDTLAVGVVCEGIGNNSPVVIAPSLNRALTRHPAYRRSIFVLRESGVRVVQDRLQHSSPKASGPDNLFEWRLVEDEMREVYQSGARKHPS
jgi:phosphopantothenoylcysteine synthetase/decarboxylase